MAGEAELERMVVRLLGNASQYEKTLKTSTKATETFAKRTTKFLDAVSVKVGSLGRSLSLRVTAPLLAMGTASVFASANFQKGFLGVEKTVDATATELAVLKEGFKEMSTEIPVAIGELLKIGESAGQLGIANDNILDFTETISAMGVATNLTTEEAATSFARFANITGMPQTQISNLGSSVVALGNNLATTETEIVNMAMRLAGAGSTVGMTESQIVGFAASLSSVGLQAEAGGTAFSKLFLEIQTAVATGGKDLEEFAKVAGTSAEDFAASFRDDAGTAVINLIRGLDELSDEDKILALKDIGVQGTRMTDALLRASGAVDLFDESMSLSNKAFKENVALTEEAEKAYKGFWSQMTLLKNQLVLVAIEVGDMLTPAIIKMTEFVKRGIKWWNGLSDSTKRFIVVVAFLVATIGPLLIMLGSVVGMVSFVIANVAAAIPIVLGLGAAFTAMGISATAAWAAATLGLSLVIAGVVALGLAINKMLGKKQVDKSFLEQDTSLVKKQIKELENIGKITDPIKRDVDLNIIKPDEVVVPIKFEVIDAAAVGSAEALARIGVYEALKGPQVTKGGSTAGVSSSNGLQARSNFRARGGDSAETVAILKEMLVIQKEEAAKPTAEELFNQPGVLN